MPTELCTKMQILAESCAQRKNEPISPEVKSEFITHDIRFHASLAFLSGMMFADEAISHIWQRMYDAADRALDAEKMQAAVREHNKFLTTLAFYSSNDDEPKGMEKILKVVESHLLNALSRASEAGNSSSNPPASNAVENSLLLPSSALEFIRWFASQLADR
ncbi:FCD domain protein [Caulifigura coniformis]|uniref:FCD domain protein n=1 Tax=Caulifigura coniformis TaxID=2527983 RepID=A0A517SA57_9PLAN|nr:FCD domain-containing protein [Caulifigura coniformis]QDT53002.1 FCD domain protein [Caulifigura coniformis]